MPVSTWRHQIHCRKSENPFAHRKHLKTPFEPLLKAVGFETDAGAENTLGTNLYVQFWRMQRHARLCGRQISQSLSWLAYGSFRLIDARPTATPYILSLPFLLAFAWLYSLCRSVFRPSLTPPYDLLSLYCLLFIGAVTQLGAVVYDHGVVDAPWPPVSILAALILNLAAVTAVLTVLLGMPVAIPSARIDKDEIVRYPFLFLIHLPSSS